MATRRGRDLTTLGYRRIVQLLVYLVIIPGVLLTAIGVLLLMLERTSYNLLLGILVLSFAGTLMTGVILTWVFLARERNLSELQADFVSKVSHELRTPLTSIRMFTETLILRRGDVAAEDRCIAALNKESARLQALIDRLLDWGRMESGRRVYELAEHDVTTVVDEAINAFEPARERRNVEVVIDTAKDLPRVLCDKSALVDSLVNLLSNAYKYGGQPRRIEISARADEREVMITVRDNGKGIARNEHKRIFEKFYRVDDLLAREQEGSGIGLAIVQHVMRAHRGRVEVDSAPGHGSAFTLLLRRNLPASVMESLKPPAAEGHGDVA
jgi:two-component system phosphate regulon sensor histidine kinase PhoR